MVRMSLIDGLQVGNIDPNLCTHVVYSFAVLDTSNFGLKAHDTWLVRARLIGAVPLKHTSFLQFPLGFGQRPGKLQKVHSSEEPKQEPEAPPRRRRLDRLSEQHGQVPRDDGQRGEQGGFLKVRIKFREGTIHKWRSQ